MTSRLCWSIKAEHDIWFRRLPLSLFYGGYRAGYGGSRCTAYFSFQLGSHLGSHSGVSNTSSIFQLPTGWLQLPVFY